jgi:amino-acid N-acetyltransferase
MGGMLQRDARLTCPACGAVSVEVMPTDVCVHVHECRGCGAVLRPRPGDCCVFCSYGDVACPSRQVDVGPLAQGDEAAVRALLQRAGLPTAGFEDCGREVLVARHGDAVVGSAGLDVREGGALLRSVAVDEGYRGVGLGHQLADAALARAAALGLADVYLLTTTASDFFARFGFEVVPREAVPAAIRASIEFTSACPASATVMRRSR